MHPISLKGQEAIEKVQEKGHGYLLFKWTSIGKLSSVNAANEGHVSQDVNHVSSPPLYEHLPRSMYTKQKEWHYWLYQVSGSTSGVTPAKSRLG